MVILHRIARVAFTGVVITLSFVIITPVVLALVVTAVVVLLAVYLFYCMTFSAQVLKWSYTHTRPLDVEELRNDLGGFGMVYRAMKSAREGEIHVPDNSVKH